ncbi:MAG: 2-phosphosulfolactate phosphatase [Candidatus Eiseniibacteriota bacterium]|nr:MAG: 2-phosphosulfolactate phosphatase [Candidatus Eisenbacteria bacterium]
MKLDCYLVPSEATEQVLAGKAVVIIDVLRTCTTIAFALMNGAGRVIPAATIEAATKLMSSLDRGSTLLCGEREGKKVKGFDLGNSPLEYTREIVQDKTLVFASTNGTKLMARGVNAQEQLVCSFVNVERVVGRIRPEGPEPVVVASGMNDRFSLEDAVCAGMVATRLSQLSPGLWELNDGARAAVALFEKFGEDILRMMHESAHGKYLASLGFASDVEVSARVDSVPVLPVLKEGRITLSDS